MAYNRRTITVTRAQVFTILDALCGAEYDNRFPETQQCNDKLRRRLNKMLDDRDFVGIIPDNIEED